MSVTRRSFIKAGALSALSAGIILNYAGLALAQTSAPAGDFPIPQEAKTDPVFYFQKSTFDPYLNTTFRARARGEVVNLVLVKVVDISSPGRSALTRRARPSTGFSLLFRASAPLSGITTIHTLEHDALGTFSLFLQRTSAKESRELYYEAVFNHV